uniref:Uncharacterized protein n=1 Tax=Pan troglodytes TaxID=9598 RepID=H2R5S3_PANTR
MGATGLGFLLSWRQDNLNATDCQGCNIIYFSETTGSMCSELSLNRGLEARRKKDLKDSFLWRYGKVGCILPLREMTAWINPPQISEIFQGYHQRVHRADALSLQTNSLRSRLSSQCLGQSFLLLRTLERGRGFRAVGDICGHVHEED